MLYWQILRQINLHLDSGYMLSSDTLRNISISTSCPRRPSQTFSHFRLHLFSGLRTLLPLYIPLVNMHYKRKERIKTQIENLFVTSSISNKNPQTKLGSKINKLIYVSSIKHTWNTLSPKDLKL